MGLRGRLLLLVLLPTVPALLLALYTNLELRRSGTNRVEKDAVRLVQLAAANVNGLVAATRQHLVGLSHFPQARGNDLPAFDTFFANMTKVYTDYADFGLIETNGDLVARSLGRRGPINLADRAHVRRVLNSHDFAIGNYEAGQGAQRASLPCGYPVLDEQGRVVRVLYAALDLAALNAVLAKTQLPEGGVVEVLDREGRIVARFPDPEKRLGTVSPTPDLFSVMTAKGEGTAGTSDSDGLRRLCAFTSIHNGTEPNLYVSVGIPTPFAYAETQRMLVLNLTILGLVAVVALIAAWVYGDKHILHPVRALVKTTRRVTAGDLSARTGITRISGELNQLASAFDEMAGSLQQQRGRTERTEKALRESEQRFRQLADAMPQIVWSARPDGYLDHSNQRWYEFTGFERGSGGDESWKPILHPDDVDRCLGQWYSAVRTGQPYQIEYRFKDRRTGTYRWFLGRALPVRDEGGRIVRWFGTCTDIDDHKRAAEEVHRLNAELERRVAERTSQLEQANKELEAFSYSVSHDLRAPLRHINGFVEILRQGPVWSSLHEEGRLFLGAIAEAAQRMGTLIDDLLAFSRMGRAELRQTPVDNDELVREVVRDLTRDVIGRDIQWDIEPLPQVFADRAMIRQVWANLLSNAVKYTRHRDRAEIGISCRSTGGAYEFRVRDNGAGFDMQYVDKLFGVFQRLHQREEFDGTGIGLANVRRIVTRHGGRAWAEGKTGEGATFYFTIPRNQDLSRAQGG